MEIHGGIVEITSNVKIKGENSNPNFYRPNYKAIKICYARKF